MQNILIFLDFIKKLYKNRGMIKSMAARDFKARYVGSLFGLFWALLNPLAEVVVYGIVFGLFFKSTPDPVYGTDSYMLFLLCGIVPWQFFSQAVVLSAGAVINSGMLVKKAVGFPSEVLPVITVVSNVISHLIGLGLLLIILAFSGRLTPYALLVPVYLFFGAVLTVGIGWMLSSVNVFLRDVQQVIGLAMMGLFFFTPIFYSPAIFPAWALRLARLNPLYHIIDGYRLALLAGRPIPAWDFLYLAVFSFATLGLGGLFFRRLKPSFAEVL